MLIRLLKAMFRKADRERARERNREGIRLQQAGRIDEALAAFRGALEADAHYGSAHVNIGNILNDRGALDDAIAHYRRAVACDPGDPVAHQNLGMALEEDFQYEAALAAYRRAYEIDPSDGARIKMATLLPWFPRSTQEIDELRGRFGAAVGRLAAEGARLDDPLREVGQTNFLLAYHGRNDRELQAAVAALYERACPALLHEAAHCGRPRRAGPLRIGFASKFLGAHSVGIWFNRLIARLAQLPGFEVSVFNLAGASDETLRQAVHSYEVLPQDLGAARAAIAARELDVLAYADIGMEPFGYFLAFSRLAPVQCAMLGHPVTSGIRNVDYFISSALFEPEGAQAHYRERLAALDALPVLIPPPPRPAAPKSRAALGLPEDRNLYVSPMMLHKFHPDFDAALAAILRADPKGEVVLFKDGRYARRHEPLAERLAAAMPDVAGRVRFLPWASQEDLLSILLTAEAIVDSFHFSAGTTAFLALGVGRPIVTLPGEFVRGRPTYGCYRKMGVMDFVAGSPEEFVRLALRLGTDAAYREAARARVAEHAPKLFDDPAAVDELARFLREAVTSSGARPSH